MPVLNEHTQQPESLCAYVVTTEGKPSDAAIAQLQIAMRDCVPEYAVPRLWVGLDVMPTRPGNGKLDLKRLPPPPRAGGGAAGSAAGGDGDGGSGSGGSAAARGGGEVAEGLEAIIQRVWAAALSAPTLGLDDNFFDVGGHSLIAASVTGTLAGSFGLVGLTVIDLFSNPTVRLLGAHLRRQGHGEAEGAGATRREGRRGAAHAELPDPLAVRRFFANRGGTPRPHGAAIAVVGMAGVFPGAPSVDRFWRNLQGGVDSLTRFSRDELAARGVPEEVYVASVYGASLVRLSTVCLRFVYDLSTSRRSTAPLLFAPHVSEERLGLSTAGLSRA